MSSHVNRPFFHRRQEVGLERLEPGTSHPREAPARRNGKERWSEEDRSVDGKISSRPVRVDMVDPMD